MTDAYQCDGLYPWDAAAGTLIVREAGGYVCSSNGKARPVGWKRSLGNRLRFSGDDFDLMNPNFIAASTKRLAMEYVAVEKKADAERKRDSLK